MATRRDELNAYSFARKRTVASFLKPLPNGSTESAPRPVRTILPTVVLGTVILVGFGACGILKPSAPQGWDEPGVKVIVGDQSTTRYVVLCSEELEGDQPCPKNKRLLHPVLNLASARLLLKDSGNFEVVKVKESVLDGPDAPQHSVTVGIPYAPDRLPSAEVARTKKTWALCERPGESEDAKSQRAVFVMSNQDEHRKKLTSTKKGKLDASHSMYVEDPDGKQYLVDHRGVAHLLDATAASGSSQATIPGANKAYYDRLLRTILFGDLAKPQKVTQEWMGTLIKSPLPIFLPPMKGVGGPSSTTGVDKEHRIVGKVLEANGTHYVVLEDRVAQVSDFVAKLLLEGPVGRVAYQGRNPEVIPLGAASVVADDEPYLAELRPGVKVPWPTEVTQPANTEDTGNQVVCSVYHGGNREGAPGVATEYRDMSTWVGKDYPAPIAGGASSAYVTPGSGLLYRQVTGEAKDSGSLFLLTDTGLRYSVQANNDSANSSGNAQNDVNQAQIRLGYQEISSYPLVPKEWSQLLSAGPSLNTGAARQPQGS
ncbi:type VII secretion protein EccB [Streptomyces sp. KR80]|uniref:type VII secretion protein EccB n=1 Tax=Streptomyces sp. KR80 TaxID=3457426 RepID=UPI003FCF2C3D